MKRNAIIGINVVVMDDAVVGDSSIVAASAFIKAGMAIPPRVLAAGIPAKVIRELSEEEMGWKIEGTETHQDLTRRNLATRKETTRPLAAVEADRKRIHMPGVVLLTELRKQAD